MTPENYRSYIVDMLEGISDEEHLQHIYTTIHRAFINEGVKSVRRAHSMSEEQLRQGIDDILAGLDIEGLSRIYFMLLGMTGKVVPE